MKKKKEEEQAVVPINVTSEIFSRVMFAVPATNCGLLGRFVARPVTLVSIARASVEQLKGWARSHRIRKTVSR
jgi:hypothetical protein